MFLLEMELFSPGTLDLGMLFIKVIWQLDLDSRSVEVFPCFPSNGHTVADDRPPGSVGVFLGWELLILRQIF